MKSKKQRFFHLRSDIYNKKTDAVITCDRRFILDGKGRNLYFDSRAPSWRPRKKLRPLYVKIVTKKCARIQIY